MRVQWSLRLSELMSELRKEQYELSELRSRRSKPAGCSISHGCGGRYSCKEHARNSVQTVAASGDVNLRGNSTSPQFPRGSETRASRSARDSEVYLFTRRFVALPHDSEVDICQLHPGCANTRLNMNSSVPSRFEVTREALIDGIIAPSCPACEWQDSTKPHTTSETT